MRSEEQSECEVRRAKSECDSECDSEWVWVRACVCIEKWGKEARRKQGKVRSMRAEVNQPRLRERRGERESEKARHGL